MYELKDKLVASYASYNHDNHDSTLLSIIVQKYVRLTLILNSLQLFIAHLKLVGAKYKDKIPDF